MRIVFVILNGLSYTDKIGHLFIVDIKFHDKNEKAMLFNETYTPIFEKNKVIQVDRRSLAQLMTVLNKNEEKDLVNNFKSNAKTHSTRDDKKFIPLYAEHIRFLMKRAGWLVTKIYQPLSSENLPLSSQNLRKILLS